MATFGFVLSYPSALTEMWGLEPKLPVIRHVRFTSGLPVESAGRQALFNSGRLRSHEETVVTRSAAMCRHISR
jgi:hypothetical protein